MKQYGIDTDKIYRMDIQIVSDLHIEHYSDDIPDPLDYITPTSDILLLAGDIGSIYKFNQLKGFLQRVCEHFKIVLYVPGNHEYYMRQNHTPVSFNKLNFMLSNIESEIPNLFLLSRRSVIIGDTCIIGCTLWSDAKISIPRYIVRVYGMHNDMYDHLHKSDLEYIQDMIEHCKENSLTPVVATHHCPSHMVLPPRKAKDRYTSLYVSNLDHLLTEDKVHTWISGHIHHNFDMITPGGTRLVGNQYGKPKDNITDFGKNFVVTIPQQTGLVSG